MKPLPTEEEWKVLCKAAQRVACDFIGYPTDEEDVTSIENATPLQAIEALEGELRKVLEFYHGESGRLQRIKSYLLDQPWHKACEIVPNYMPPYPLPYTKPSVVVVYHDGSKYEPKLRYSHGPLQGYFWDISGDDFQNEELAILALSKAPTPVNVGPLEFRFKLNDGG